MQQPSLNEKLRLASDLFGSKPTTQSAGGGSASGGAYLAGEGISITDRVISAEVTQSDLDEVSNSIPTTVSELENDAGFVNAEHTHDQYLTEHQSLADYAKKSEIPTVPTNVSAFSNDAGYITSVPSEYVTEEELAGKGYATTAAMNTALSKKVNDFSIEIYNGTGGNPKPVRFASFVYATCDSENGIAAKISLVSGHGNGSSYAFLEDAIIKVNHLGGVEVDNFKYYGADAGVYGNARRQYGDIFWVLDTSNKRVEFYVLMGQYARVYQTPWKRLTYSSGGSVAQYDNCTVYSSGDKVWANNSEIALMSDMPDDYLPLSGGTLTGPLYGTSLGSDLLRWNQVYGREYYFENVDDSYTSPYKFGMYQWDDNFTFVTRNSANTHLMDAWQINGGTGATNFLVRPTLNGTGLATQAEIPAVSGVYLPLAGATMNGNIIISNNNPHLGLKNSGDGQEAYFQTYNDGTLKAGFGYGWDKSLKIDTAGNVFLPGANRPKWGSSDIALTSDIPSLSGYATQSWVEGKGYLTQHQSLADYAKKSDIPTVPTKVSAFENDKGYLTQHQSLADYAKKTDIPTVPTKVSAFENDKGYLTQHQSLAGYATESWVEGKGYMTSLPYRINNYQNNDLGAGDPNNCVETGFYYIAGNGANRPPFSQSTNLDYRVLTTAYSDQWLQQIATDFLCSDVFVRRRESGVWKPWEKLAYSSEIPLLDGCAKLKAPNDLVHDGNEVTMVPDAYSAGALYLNYRTASGNQNGSINNYLFCNGRGGTGGVTLTADAFAGTAARATADGDGNNIASTYVPITDDFLNTVEVRSGDEYAGLIAHLGGTNGEAILAAESASSVAEIRVNAYGDGAIKMSAASVSVNDDPIATQAWVGGQGYLKSVPSEYVTETELAAKSYATKADLEAATGVDMSAYLPKTGGTVETLGVSGKLTQGSPSTDPTIAAMNSFQSDLFVQGDGAAPNVPQVAGFYLGKSQTDDNRHMDIVSGGDYSYIDFNKAGNNNDYDARLLVNVASGLTEWHWGGSATSRVFNVAGTIQQNGANLATQSDLSAYQIAPVTLYDNASGTTGTVTLSESAANFSYLEIHAMLQDGVVVPLVKVRNPDGKKADLNWSGVWSGGNVAVARARVAISGLSITFNSNYQVTMASGGTHTVSTNVANLVYITKVLGYR